MLISKGGQQFARIFTASVMLLVIVWSIAFCFLAIESMVGMAHANNQDLSSFPMHVEHMQALSSATISQANSFSTLIASLLFTLVAFVFIVFSHKPLLSPQLAAHRKWSQPDAIPVDQSELYWFSRFVRSPEFLRPA